MVSKKRASPDETIRTRDAQLLVRLKPEELEWIQRAAERGGMTTAHWVRSELLRYAIPLKSWYDFLREGDSMMLSFGAGVRRPQIGLLHGKKLSLPKGSPHLGATLFC